MQHCPHHSPHRGAGVLCTHLLLCLSAPAGWGYHMVSHRCVCVLACIQVCHKHNSGMNGPVCSCCVHTHTTHSSSPFSASGRFHPAGYSRLPPSLSPLVLHRVVLHLCHLVRSSHGVSHDSNPLLHTIWYTHTHTHSFIASTPGSPERLGMRLESPPCTVVYQATRAFSNPPDSEID